MQEVPVILLDLMNPLTGAIEVVMGALFWLSVDKWEAVEPHLLKNQDGARRVDDRRAILSIFHVVKR